MDRAAVVSSGSTAEALGAAVAVRVPLHGALTSTTARASAEAVLSAARERAGDVVIDLADVTYVDVAGLQVLYAAAKWAKNNGRALTIVGATAAVESECTSLGSPLAAITGVES